MGKFTKLSAMIFTLLLVSNGFGQSLFFSGYGRNYTGALINGDHEYTIIQNTFNLNIEHSKNNVAFKVNPYIYQYPNAELKLNLREAYMDIFFDAMDLRIGKQQIIWGKADGVFITDIISPKDLSEFLLRDFEEIRTGITSIKADYYMGNNTLELVWAPTFTPTIMPDDNSFWYPQMYFPIAPTFDNSKRDVEQNVGNGEYFAKYSVLSSAIDFEIMAGYMWDDDPTMHITKTMNSQTKQLTSLTITPEHHRLGLGGGSFSSTLGSFVLRGEGAYYNGKYFNTENPQIADGVVEKNYLHYLVGLEFTLFNINMSTQFIQQAILDYDKPIKNDEFENTMTFLAYKTFLRETLRLELFSYIGLNNSDALVRPKITYDFSDGFQMVFGANIFVGDECRFGQYDDNDMLYAKIKYSF